MNIPPHRSGNHEGHEDLRVCELSNPPDAPKVQKTANAKNGMPKRNVADDLRASAAGRGCLLQTTRSPERNSRSKSLCMWWLMACGVCTVLWSGLTRSATDASRRW